MYISAKKIHLSDVAIPGYVHQIIYLICCTSLFYMQPDDMPDAEDFDEEDTWEEGLTELDRRRHASKDADLDLIEDEDDSFVDELDEEE